MSNRRRKNKKGCGCSKWIVVVLVLILVTCILIYSDVLSILRNKIEMQLYPLSYKQEILLASEKYDLEPEFICAVIHTESGFKAEAESHAGAQGLMQIMPDTFSWLADIRGESHSPDAVLIPEVNIDYGSYYLRHLTHTYGDEYTAAAAYNAGNVVSDWLQNPQYSADGVTLYSIPYPETSEYVEKIRYAEQMYQKLYFEQ